MKQSSQQLGAILLAYLFLLSSASTPMMGQAKPLIKIRLATSTAGLDFAPIWIAGTLPFMTAAMLTAPPVMH